RENGPRFRREILLRRLLVVLRGLFEEKDAVLRHFLECLRAFLLSLRYSGELRIIVYLDTQRLELRLQVLREVLRRRTHDVLLIQPQQLVWIECRGGFVYVLRIEEPCHLIEREHFLIAVRPTEAHEVIEQRLWKKTFVSILQHADRAMSLRE